MATDAADRQAPFRLWRRDNLPVAFAYWALLNNEAAARLAAGVRRLAPAE